MSRNPARGVTLVELVVFIVIVGVAMAGLFAAFNTMTAGSADPQVRKQVLAIAESLMEEVQLTPFTWCDPDDPAAATATGTGSCATVEGIGPEGGETRYNASNRFDNVSDYDGAPIGPGIKDITGTNVTGLDSYSATISVVQVGLGSGGGAIPASESLKITVTVTGPTGVSFTLEGYRTRYAPTSLP
jgi:MSHA pilin protein MshD